MSMKVVVVVIAAFFVGGVSGWTIYPQVHTETVEAPANAPRTVGYFLRNDPDRKAMVDRCKNNPGLLHSEPECINAQEAADKLFSVTFYTEDRREEKLEDLLAKYPEH